MLKVWAVMSLVVLVLVISITVSLAQGEHHPNTIRWCPEDAVIVGHGDFDGQRWESYRCIARDDL